MGWFSFKARQFLYLPMVIGAMVLQILRVLNKRHPRSRTIVKGRFDFLPLTGP
jgi:hypothetical protein